MSNKTLLPNGCYLFWEDNGVGGRTYTTTEINEGVLVWDTSLVEISTLNIAIMKERELQAVERRRAKRRGQ